ncbi:MAG: hypothetical protein A2822_00460 [Candidatus Staskawiczbacteria bacterium RIFCSPHIGHO2_01_FULL_41_41]|uniref:DUF2779 domain-containing protein n=1 Tax=Candidatus Staskawiczbacteria bacterium RIFCSPHIGHO2_01_FULL_41_41 TaxID=1802203 RepID=A0A1G2HW12_9BACT|nr:MAG: hypothetical protein A2822_00460 [Candidatus Staskawiczbacteria bacterium RIFCSPHIGHO2_01_FULL_41_41]
MNYLECPMYLWLSKNRPELLPEDDAEKERILAAGREVDEFAKKLFPKAIEIKGYNEIGFEQTQKALAQNPKALFQPTAVAGELAARADILVAGQTPGTFDINEVKMATKVKKEYLYDLGFQKICFEGAGIQIGRLKLVHINGNYVRHGEINPSQLFDIEDITEDVNEKLPQIQDEIQRALKIINLKEEPSVTLINSCANPKYCDYIEHYSKISEDIFPLAENIQMPHLLHLLEREILDHKKVPATLLGKIGFEPPVEFTNINTEGIKRELAKLQYPLYFFDYETYNCAIPPFDGTTPYQQIPFQYSLHIQDAPGAQLRHADFLAQTFENPIPGLLEHLQKDMGSKGSVIVWFAPFETGRNKEMALGNPEFAQLLNSINERMFDLMVIFKFKNQLYTKSEFKKLASLKVILPVLCPELSYKDLAIQEGGTASASWPIMTNPQTPPSERERLKHDMVEYCKRDTLAMAAILERVRADLDIVV